MRSLTSWVLACACAAGSVRAGVTSQTYDAALGTAPVVQGFQAVNIPMPGPPIAVGGGLLRQDTRGHRQTPGNAAGYQYFTGALAPADFSAGLSISAELQVIESSYDPDFVGLGGVDSRNAGYGITAIDDLGRIIALGISETGLFLNADVSIAESAGTAFFPFDTTAAPHVYTLDVSAAGIDVAINGNPALSLPLGAVGEVPQNFGFVAFGDIFDDRAGVPSESVTDLASFTYTIVPEPGGMALLLAGAGGWIVRRCGRRRA
jgi:hypothetical protein